MTRQEKKEFCTQLIEGVKSLVMERLECVPENWSGIELRWFINEVFDDQCVFGQFRDHRTKRYRKYHNDVIVNCL